MEADELIERILLARTPRDILGLDGNETKQQIRQKYLNISRQIHPDKHLTNPEKANKAFQKLSSAYSHLNDPLKHPWKQQQSGSAGSSHESPFPGGEFGEEQLREAFYDVLSEVFNGNYLKLFFLLGLLRKAHPELNKLDDDQLRSFLDASRDKLSTLSKLSTRVKESFFNLAALYGELSSLSYFAFAKRTSILVSILQALVQIPILLNEDEELGNNQFLSPKAVVILKGTSLILSTTSSLMLTVQSYSPFG